MKLYFKIFTISKTFDQNLGPKYKVAEKPGILEKCKISDLLN